MDSATKYLSFLILLTAPLLGACGDMAQEAQAAHHSPSAPQELGVCEPDQTAAACETVCTRTAECARDPWTADAHWSCTERCVRGVFERRPSAESHVACMLASGNQCDGVNSCLSATAEVLAQEEARSVESSSTDLTLPFDPKTDDYCEIIANEYTKCDAWKAGPWSMEYFVNICSIWSHGFRKKIARCVQKHEGTCGKVLDCYDLPRE